MCVASGVVIISVRCVKNCVFADSASAIAFVDVLCVVVGNVYCNDKTERDCEMSEVYASTNK